MRLSTAGMHRTSIDAILEHQVKLAKTQEQITTGKKFQTAAEDPIGATRAAALDRTLADNAQYARNSNIIESAPQLRGAVAGRRHLAAAVRARSGAAGREFHAGSGGAHACWPTTCASSSRHCSTCRTATTAMASICSPARPRATTPFALGTTGVNYQGDLTNRADPHLEHRSRWPTVTTARTCS